MSITITYLTNAALELTSSAGSSSVVIQCWGAGGHGSSTGNGGSGGAYAEYTAILDDDDIQIVVGQATSADGGDTFVTSSVLADMLVRAPGGKRDGTIYHQPTLLTGSVTYVGGAGSPDFTGYSSYNGSGGGGAGGTDGNGSIGVSAFYSTRDSSVAGGAAGAGGGVGGCGAYYYAGSGKNQVMTACDGSVPGGGGGGAYDYGVDDSGAGAAGKVVVTID